MAEAARQKLKVFQAQFGFYDTVVAASSQAAALRVWGTQQNLFASGAARVTTDEAAASAALKHPETLLRRAVGSQDRFELQPERLPDVPDEPKRSAAASKAPARSVAKPKVKPPDRSKLDAAEATLSGIDQARKAREADLRRRQDELDEEASEAQSAYAEARKTATEKVVKARRSYRAAGGKD